MTPANAGVTMHPLLSDRTDLSEARRPTQRAAVGAADRPHATIGDREQGREPDRAAQLAARGRGLDGHAGGHPGDALTHVLARAVVNRANDRWRSATTEAVAAGRTPTIQRAITREGWVWSPRFARYYWARPTTDGERYGVFIDGPDGSCVGAIDADTDEFQDADARLRAPYDVDFTAQLDEFYRIDRTVLVDDGWQLVELKAGTFLHHGTKKSTKGSLATAIAGDANVPLREFMWFSDTTTAERYAGSEGVFSFRLDKDVVLFILSDQGNVERLLESKLEEDYHEVTDENALSEAEAEAVSYATGVWPLDGGGYSAFKRKTVARYDRTLAEVLDRFDFAGYFYGASTGGGLEHLEVMLVRPDQCLQLVRNPARHPNQNASATRQRAEQLKPYKNVYK